MLYIKEQPPPAAGADSAAAAAGGPSAGTEAAPEGGLSAGAIAGIAVGALTVALGAALAGWALLRRRPSSNGVAPSLAAKEEGESSASASAAEALAHSQPPANPFQALKAATVGSSSLSSPAAPGSLASGVGVRTAGQLSSAVAASPFAARRGQMGAPGTPTLASATFSVGSSGGSAPTSQPPGSGELLPELLAFRALEDGAGSIGLTSGSSGAGGMGTDSSTQCASPTSSAPLVVESLPSALQDW